MRRKFSRPILEQLERRELFAGDVVPTLQSPSVDGFCGPLPLPPAEVVSPLREAPTADTTAGEEDIFAHYGYGNITAEKINGVLVIRGDGGRNYFRLYSYGANGYAIDPHLTKVNGQYYNGGTFETRYVTFQDISGIDIDLGDGDDSVTIHATKVPSLTIRTGAGDDQVILMGTMPVSMVTTMAIFPYPVLSGPRSGSVPKPLRVEGDLLIDTGAGHDRVMPFAKVSGDATVMMGEGDDSYIEAPYDVAQHSSIPDIVDGIYWYRPPARVIGELTGDGALTIDLGADQDAENIPADWRSDENLGRILQNVPRVLDFYRDLIARGEAPPGMAQIIKPPYPDVPARIDANGRLEIEFGFARGYERVIERLQARGVVLEAYSIATGRARALVREEDLKLFANLPELTTFITRSYLYPRDSFQYQSDPEWDYIRPSSTTADEYVELPPHTPVIPTELEFPGIIYINADPDPAPVLGPPRLEDVKVRAAGDFGSLLESYYGSVVVGPQEL